MKSSICLLLQEQVISKVSTSYTGEFVAEEITQEWAGSDWENEEKETYTYEDDQLTVVLNQIWENNDWVNERKMDIYLWRSN